MQLYQWHAVENMRKRLIRAFQQRCTRCFYVYSDFAGGHRLVCLVSLNRGTLCSISKVRNLVIEFKPYQLPEYTSEYTLYSSNTTYIRPNQWCTRLKEVICQHRSYLYSTRTDLTTLVQGTTLLYQYRRFLQPLSLRRYRLFQVDIL